MQCEGFLILHTSWRTISGLINRFNSRLPQRLLMKSRFTLCLLSGLFASTFIAQEESEPVIAVPIATMQFEELEYDFGQVFQDSENSHVFKFTNAGSVPLIISSAKGSCGCTVPFYPKEPIMPGEESEIHVIYKPGTQKGTQVKSVTLTANTAPMVLRVEIKADVLESDFAVDPSIFAMDEEQEKNRDLINAISPGCFAIFPNPTSSEIHLDLKQHIGRSADIQIYDQAGANMLKTRIEDISSETSLLDVSSFAAGIYIISIQVEGQQPMSQCFVVDR